MSRLTISILFLAACITVVASATEVPIGGSRRVRAVVTEQGPGVVCKVSFIPVGCFDAGMNNTVNQQKARAYVTLALGRFKGLADGSIDVRGLHAVTAPVVVDGLLTVSYEAELIRLLNGPKASPGKASAPMTADGSGARQIPLETQLFSCLEDTKETLHSVERSLAEQITRLRAGDDLQDQVAEVEGRAFEAFVNLSMEVKSQKLLLQVEKDELLPQISVSQNKIIQYLSKVYKALENPKR